MNALDVLLSILDLGRHHQAIGDGFSKISAATAAGDSEAAEISAVANDIFLERDEGIVGLILTVPAITLADAAVQLLCALNAIDGEYIDDWPLDAKGLVRRVRRVLVSTAVVTTHDAGIDPAMMGYPDFASICRQEFPSALLDGGAVRPGECTIATDRDVELIRLCDQLLDLLARMEALLDVRRTVEDEERTEPDLAALYQERAEVVDQITALSRARTPRGRDVLARAALALAERDDAGGIVTRTKGGALAWMVVQSLATGIQ